MKVLWSPGAATVVRHGEPSVRRRLKAAVALLAKDPSGRSVDLDVKRLETDGKTALYRLRVGDWRVGFAVQESILVLHVFHRDEGYGWLVYMP